MSRVAGQEDSAGSKRVGYLHPCSPRIRGEHLDRDRFGSVANQIVYQACRIDCALFGADAHDDAPPLVDEIQSTHQARLTGVEDPVMHGVAETHPGRQRLGTKDDVEVRSLVGTALILRTDCLAHHAAGPVASDEELSNQSW